jgi:phosphatidylglycerophosphatase A
MYKGFLNQLCYWIAVGGGTGFLPMPGTAGTLFIGIPLLYLITWQVSSKAMSLLMIIIVTIVSERIVTAALSSFHGAHDPQCINLDEVVGLLWALQGLPLSLRSATIGFLLFRVFDITKVLGIGLVQQFEGAWGIIADDVLAGIYTRCLMVLFFL